MADLLSRHPATMALMAAALMTPPSRPAIDSPIKRRGVKAAIEAAKDSRAKIKTARKQNHRRGK